MKRLGLSGAFLYLEDFILIKTFVFGLLSSVQIVSAQTSVTCDLAYASDPAGDVSSQIVFNETLGRLEAIYISKWGTRTYICHEALTDKYECYGYAAKPGEAPTQLVVVGDRLDTGTLIVASTLNLVFLEQFFSNGFDRNDVDTRRVAIDTFVVKYCQ